MKLQVKRVYDAPSPSDGQRILIDRLWPRGLSKAEAKIDLWLKEIAPSTGLRRWYDHDPDKWPEFKNRYFLELDANPDTVAELKSRAVRRRTTLLYASSEEKLNNAFALKEYLEDRSR